MFIGRNCMLEKEVYFRLVDPHFIYDVEMMGWINPSKSFYMGDHMWFSQKFYY